MIDSIVNRVDVRLVYALVTGRTVQDPSRQQHANVRCPSAAHHDEHPSCTLDIRRSVWKCHVPSCGAKGGILDMIVAAGKGFDRAEAARWLEKQIDGSHVTTVGKRIVASFVYCDVNEKPVARVDRVEPGRNGRSKEFFPHIALATGGFEHKPGLKGTILPLYRVDEVRASIEGGELVFLGEGEGKCDKLREALRLAGFRAAVTTLQGGAEAPMRAKHIDALAGLRRLAVLADSDDAGRCAAQKRAQAVTAAYPKCDVRVIDLYPKRTDGSDVSDWLAEGHAIEELTTLIDRALAEPPSSVACPRSTTPSNEQLPAFIRASALLAEAEEAIEYVVDGMLPVGGTAVFAGRPKSGKTTTGLHLALCVARGMSWLGRSTQRGPVLYVALEGARGYWRAKLRDLGVTHDDELYVCIGRAPEAAIAWLRESIEQHRPSLVVVDTMQRLLRVKDGNDYATGSNATDAVIDLARTTGAALLMLHHSGKRSREAIVDEVMGSTAWAAAVDTVIVLRRHTAQRTIVSEQRCGTPIEETVLTLDESGNVVAAGSKADSDLTAMRDAIVSYLRESPEDDPDEPTIKAAVEGRNDHKPKALRSLVEDGILERTGAGKRGDPYRYRVPRSFGPDHNAGREN